MFAQEVARRCVVDFFTSLRCSWTRGMSSGLCGYEVCPVFAEQTTVPFQLMRGDGRTLCVCVCVGVDVDAYVYVYGSVLKKRLNENVVMHLNYLFPLHEQLQESLITEFNMERLQIRTRGGLKTKHNFQHSTFPWNCTLVNKLKEPKRKFEWGTCKTRLPSAGALL